MTDVKVEQCDEAIVDDALEALEWQMSNFRPAEGESASMCQERRLRQILAPAFARHRQAAEKATRERDAGIAERQYAGPGWSSHYRNAGAGVAAAIRSQNDD